MRYGPDLARLDARTRRAFVLTWRLFAAGVVLAVVGGWSAFILHGSTARVALGLGALSLGAALLRAWRAGYRLLPPSRNKADGAAPRAEDGP